MTIDISAASTYPSGLTQLSFNTTSAIATGFQMNIDAGGYLTYAANYFAGSIGIEGEFTYTSPLDANYKSGLIQGFGSAIIPVSNANGFSIETWQGQNSDVVKLYLTKWESSVKVETLLAGNYVSGTRYYYRLTRNTALGANSALCLEIFSSSTRSYASRLTEIVIQLAACPSIRFLTLLASNNYGNASTWSATTDNLTLLTMTSGVELTTALNPAALELDTSNKLAIYSNVIKATALNVTSGFTASGYHSIDMGVGALTDFSLSCALNITNFTSGAANTRMFSIMGAASLLADYESASVNAIAVSVVWASATTFNLHIFHKVGTTITTQAHGTTFAVSAAQVANVIFPQLTRTGSVLTLRVFADEALSNEIGSVSSWAGTQTTALRYVLPVFTNTAGALSRHSTFTVGGFKGSPFPSPRQGTATAQENLSEFSAVVGKKIGVSSGSEMLGETIALTSKKIVSSALFEMLGEFSASTGLNATLIRLSEKLGINDSNTSNKVGKGAASGNIGIFDSNVPGTKIRSYIANEKLGINDRVTSIAYHNLTYKRINWFITDFDINGIEQPVTGLTPTFKFLRDSDAMSLDFADQLFKAHADCVTITATMTELDATYYPGWYNYSLQTNGLGAGINTAYIPDAIANDTRVTPNKKYYANDVMVFKDGVLQWGGMTFDEHTQLMANPTLPQIRAGVRDELTAELNTLESIYTEMVRVTGNAGGLTFEQWKLTLVALPTAEENAAAVWLDANAIKMIKLGTNKHVLNPADGTVKIYDNDNATVIYTGLAYMDAAGTQLYNGTSAVHHTTRLV